MTAPDTFWDLFAGYAVFWCLLAFLIFRLMSEQKKLTQSVERLRRVVDGLAEDSASEAAVGETMIRESSDERKQQHSVG